MKPIPLQALATFCNGTLHGGDPQQLVSSVSTDSRTVGEGEVFVALNGVKFDGHDYVAQVASNGVAAVVVSRVPEVPPSCAMVVVGDTLKALQDLAHNYRQWHQLFVLGITGSSGKTSVKDMAIAVLSSTESVCGTIGNLNNHIGLPLSILRLKDGDTCGVFEMGMNHPGEIAPLAAIARPDAGIISNVGIAHIENMGSRAAIAKEKGMLAEAVHAQGFVVLNATDDYTDEIAGRCRATVVRAGINAGDVVASDLRASLEGTAFTLDFAGEKHEAFLPIPGEHMVANATLAAAAGWKHGIAPALVVDALRKVKLSKGRLEPIAVHGVMFLQDAYNANPESMKAGLRTLAGLECTGNRVAVLGRMGELGEHAVTGHREAGVFAADLGINAIFTVGHEAHLISEAAYTHNASVSVKHFNDHADCAIYLRQYLHPGDLVLLKGSRSAAMEQVLTHFQTS